MKVVVGFLRVILCLILLSQYQTFSVRQLHHSAKTFEWLAGSKGLHEHDQQQHMKGKNHVPGWWHVDYSLPHRRRPLLFEESTTPKCANRTFSLSTFTVKVTNVC
ncbi:hypothetical protein JHK87_044420 [Glycine soja]|nr:hypothetical protein JHK87_044420 [Glycine soja]